MTNQQNLTKEQKARKYVFNLLTMSHISDDKRWYKSQNNNEELKKSSFATNVSLVLLLYSMGMNYVHHHIEKTSCQMAQTFITKNSR